MKFDLGSQFLDGEFKLVVKDKDGNIKKETDWQHNLFLENGMKLVFGAGGCVSNLGNENKDLQNPAAQLIIGTGSTEPNINQTTMTAPQKVVDVSDTNREFVREEPTSSLHPGFVKLTNTLQYTFQGFTEGLNITEIGLCASNKNWNNPTTREYWLTTRALIKANDNIATAITVLSNEVLIVYYKLSVFVDIKRKTGEFTLTTTDAQNNTRTDTFEYFIQPHIIASSQAYFRINTEFGTGSSKYINSYGVKETDNELSASYSLTDSIYNSLTHLDISPITKNTAVVGGNKYLMSQLQPIPYTGSIIGNDHGRGSIIEHNYTNKRITIRATSGINTHNWENGIRAFIFWHAVRNNSLNAVVARYLVVVKNKANGQGIKKTNLHEWTLDYTITMGRWNGD